MERKPVYAVTLNNSLSTHPLISQFSVYLPEPCSAAVASTGFFFFFTAAMTSCIPRQEKITTFLFNYYCMKWNK